MNSIKKVKLNLYGAGPNNANQKQVWNNAMDLLVEATSQKLYTSTTLDFSSPTSISGSNYYIFNLPPIIVDKDWSVFSFEWEISGLHPGYDVASATTGTNFAFFSSFNTAVNAENQPDDLHSYFEQINTDQEVAAIINNPLHTNSPYVGCNRIPTIDFSFGNVMPHINLEDAHISYQEDGSTAITNTVSYGTVSPNSYEDIVGDNGQIVANMYHPLAATNTAELVYFSTSKDIYTSFIFRDDMLEPAMKDSFQGEKLTFKMDVQYTK